MGVSFLGDEHVLELLVVVHNIGNVLSVTNGKFCVTYFTTEISPVLFIRLFVCLTANRKKNLTLE